MVPNSLLCPPRGDLHRRSINQDTYQGKPNEFPVDHEYFFNLAHWTEPDPFKAFVMKRYPSNYPFTPEHTEVVKRLQEVFCELDYDWNHSVYQKDYLRLPYGRILPAEANPQVKGNALYKPPYDIRSTTSRIDYRGKQLPHILKSDIAVWNPKPRRGMDAFMFPTYNQKMETTSTYYDEYINEGQVKCRVAPDKRVFKPKGPLVQKAKAVRDKMPVYMHPIN